MKTAVLLVNLGTPNSPSVDDVGQYLDQFLNDERVIDLSTVGRRLLVNGVIVPFRRSKSAKLYSEVWTENGSPLMIYGQELKAKLQHSLGDNYEVFLAMRYQNPGLIDVLKQLENPVYSQIIVFPLFPQYSSACNGSVHQLVMETVSKWQVIPPMEFVNSYCTNPDFISAWEEKAAKHKLSNYDHILFSYHGLPERQLRKADYTKSHCLVKESCCDVLNDKNRYCYRAQCFETTRQIAKRLNLSKDQYSVCFQSRLGKDPWIQPYTEETLRKMAKEGKKKLLVFAPAFVADCLETIHEIGVEYHELFLEIGGEKLDLVESLNSSDTWVKAIENMIKERTLALQ